MRQQVTDDVSVGRVLADRYHLSSLIGEGRLAHVYHATDRALGRPVAVKVLRPGLAVDERLLARFQREAKVGASFVHHAMVKVYDAGSDDGLHFVVMEPVPGRTLEALLDEQATVQPERAVDIAVPVCGALRAAHERGLVHGDLRPANIILTPSGKVKVTGFGGAPTTATGGLTTETILSTRAYCSPEQAMGEPADACSDIYSLGVVLHRMLTGELPRAGMASADPSSRHDDQAPSSDGAVPPSLRAVVRRATAIDPADRQQSARELRSELMRARRELSGSASSGAADEEDPSGNARTSPLSLEEPRADEAPMPARLRYRSLPLPIRLATVNALVAAAALMVVIGLTLQLTRGNLYADLRGRLEAVAQSFEQGPAARVAGPGELAGEAEGWLAAQAFPDDQVVAVRAGQGEVLTASGGLALREVPRAWDLLASRESRWWNLTGDHTTYLALTVPLVRDGRQVGTLVAVAGQARADTAWRTLLSTVGGASAVGLAVATLLAFATVRRTLRPLSHISRQVDDIQAGGELRRVGEDGPRDEVGRLASAFNRMLTRLDNTIRSQRRFVADASHELRTPLTVAKGQLELAAGETDQVEARQALTLVDAELDRMGHIVRELLLLAQLDEGLPLAREPVEVELVLQEALLRGLQKAQREATVEVDPDVYVLADRDRLLQVLSNLVTNAVQHAGENARIHLRARPQGGRVTIEVRDDGRGIPREDLPHLFDRFYRAGGESGGAGLGLAIAASITRAMGGQITVRSSRDAGTVFSVFLPVA